MGDTRRIRIDLQRGTDNVILLLSEGDNGWDWRSSSTAYAVNDVRKIWPDRAGTALYLRCTTAGTSAASPPAQPTAPGDVVVDGSVVWVAQADTIYPIPNTGYAAALIFRAAPDAPGPATFTLTSPSGGIVLGGADSRVTITVTGAQVELLLAAWPYGYALLRMTPPVGAPPTFPVDASIEIGAAQ